MTKFIKNAFAVAGDRAAVPNDTQPDGSVSWEEGYPIDYQKQLGVDADAKAILRNQYNEIMYDVSNAVQQYQTHGFPDFITTADNDGAPYPYDINAIVRYSDNLYVSLVSSNTELPTNPANWHQLGLSETMTAQVSASIAQVIAPGANRLVHFNTVDFDPQNIWSGASNYEFQPTLAGYYLVYGTVLFDAMNASQQLSLAVFKNGAIYKRISFDQQQISFQAGLNGQTIVEMNGTTDTLQLYVDVTAISQNIGGNINDNFFGLSYVGPL